MEQVYPLAHRCQHRRIHNSVPVLVALSYTMCKGKLFSVRQVKILKFSYLDDQKRLDI
jgi:hypothetical protein